MWKPQIIAYLRKTCILLYICYQTFKNIDQAEIFIVLIAYVSKIINFVII